MLLLFFVTLFHADFILLCPDAFGVYIKRNTSYDFFHFLIKCCTILISTKMFKNNVSQKLLEHIHSCANSFLFQADKGPGVEWIRVVLCCTSQNATVKT